MTISPLIPSLHRGVVIAAACSALAFGAGCGDERYRDDMVANMVGGDPSRGPQLIRSYGCGTCHTVSGVVGANGLVGPPLNGIAEIAGPEQFRLDELIRRALKARNDPREVITDPYARYYGIAVSQRTLLPGDDARIGNTHFKDWLRQATSRSRTTTPTQ